MAGREERGAARAEPHLFVVLGGTGDLMARKLLPALHELTTGGAADSGLVVLGVGTSDERTDESYRAWALDALGEAFADKGGKGGKGGATGRDDLDGWCTGRLHYQSIGAGDADAYARLARRIEEIEREHGLPGNRILYLALPPQVFGDAIEGLGGAGLDSGPGWTRVVIEKPFGRDLASAEELNRVVHGTFDESQVYRIDHYLGKETVQNLLVFRFANTVFESLWNRQEIDCVQITVAEDLGVEERAGYYERAGALRDMVQNHLTQLLTLVAMEAPARYQADAIRDEKVKVLHAARPILPESVVFGQYDEGTIDGETVRAYRDEDRVADGSRTETFVALEVEVETWRWTGVPFYLRTGKRLPKKRTEIDVVFKRPPVSFFQSLDSCDPHTNVLRIVLQPDEGFSLLFEVKTPGDPVRLDSYALDFSYADAFEPLPDAYRTLLLDVMEGDQTLFVRADEVEASWRLYTPLLERDEPVESYPAGSWGPDGAEKLLARSGRSWRSLEE